MNTSPELKRFQVNWLGRQIGKLYLKVAGWKVENKMPDLKQTVLIVAHHTSNWDFSHGLAISFKLNINPYWIGKHTLFKKPFGGIMRWLGGIPVDRKAAGGVVEQMVEKFRQYENFILVITPEGTRQKVERWKDGFYRIAHAANVPISCGFLDFKRKVSGIGLVLHPTGNIQADLTKIREFYDNVVGKFPENQGHIYLPGE
ncbi:MAG: lysophospholipid acyltransferase family protein [Calditrichaeota bacterium]|nr:lysophospholipid acyltransferase family protein [Calditrichota bacterium]